MKKKMKKITVKKLYNNCASIRDYIVNKCVLEEKGICVHYRDWKMTLTVEDLKGSFQFHDQLFKSKWGTKPYQLLDFRFKPDSLKGK